MKTSLLILALTFGGFTAHAGSGADCTQQNSQPRAQSKNASQRAALALNTNTNTKSKGKQIRNVEGN